MLKQSPSSRHQKPRHPHQNSRKSCESRKIRAKLAKPTRFAKKSRRNAESFSAVSQGSRKCARRA
eukprot:8291459-Karenia_brevis.AAC.1